jgi:hypothetical protein
MFVIGFLLFTVIGIEVIGNTNCDVEIKNNSKTKYYGVDTIHPEEFSFLKDSLRGNCAILHLQCDIQSWETALQAAEKSNIKIVIWPLGGGHQNTAWAWNGYNWDISLGRTVLEYAENYVTSGGDALLAVVMSHEPFWNYGNPFSTEQMKSLYTTLKNVAPHVELFVYFGGLAHYDSNPHTRIEDGIADIACIWMHCFGGAGGTCEEALQAIDEDYELIQRKGLNMQLFFLIQSFGLYGTKYRMPSATEMLDFGTQAFEKNKLDGIIWYTWNNPWIYTEWLSKDRYDNEGKDRWAVVRQLAFNYMGSSVYVNIDKPENGLYLFNRKVLQLGRTVIIGPITIEIDADAISGIYKVEFYVDDVLEEIIYEEPFYWYMNQRLFGQHSLKVIVYDHTGNTAIESKDITVYNFFGHN